MITSNVTTQVEQRPFRVSVRNTVELDIEVEAATIEEARAKAKAFEWYPYNGHQEISGHWVGDVFVSEPSSLYWKINDVDFHIVSVEEIETDAEQFLSRL